MVRLEEKLNDANAKIDALNNEKVYHESMLSDYEKNNKE
jgi:hypothetical protein